MNYILSHNLYYLWFSNPIPMSKNCRFIFLTTLYFLSLTLNAQESSSVFNFLNLPTSSRALALGGKNISAIDDDASLIFQNPALMSSVSDKTLSFNFLTYMKGGKAGNISYVQAHRERGTWGVMAQFLGYGNAYETDEWGNVLGEMNMLDMNIAAGYSYLLGERWVGGVSGKFLYSTYAGYSSIALAVDLGINYLDSERDFSVSLVAANLGGQVTAFGETAESLPMDLQVGISKGLGSFPARLHLTLFDMFHWNKKQYFSADGNVSGFQVFLNHINIGADLSLMKDRVWIGLGYNFRRAMEMKAGGSSHAAGLTVGAGINIKKIKVGVAYGNYHAGAPTISATVAYSFAREKKVSSNTSVGTSGVQENPINNIIE